VKRLKVRLSAICLLALSAAAALAQGGAGAIAGRITNVDGEPVRSGSIQAKNTATGAVYTSAISAGNYTLNPLPPGTYDLSMNNGNAFLPFEQKGVAVQDGGTVRVDITQRGYEAVGDNITEVSNDMRANPVPTGPTPRMPDGKPDFSGLWLNVLDGNPAPPLPLQPWADAIRHERVANNSKDMPQALCQPSSPIQIVSSFPYKLVQTPTLIVMLEEFDVAMVRQVFLDGRPHPDPKTGKMGSRTWNPSWLGHSVGRWEGDTLVIDTVGFNDRSWFMTSPHTEQLHVIERLRRPDLGHLEIDVTAEDPGAFSAPWKRHLIATIGAKDEEIEEFICNEDNIDISHLVGK
jgi:Carboxypeptidase regulatory-like domain